MIKVRVIKLDGTEMEITWDAEIAKLRTIEAIAGRDYRAFEILAYYPEPSDATR